MIAVLAKLVPFRDYAYAAAAIAAVAYYNIHVHELNVHYAAAQVAAVEKAENEASAKAFAAAKALADAKDKQYSIQLSQVEDTYETQLKAADDQHASDIVRLRQLAAQGSGNANPVLSGSSGSGASGSGGDEGAGGLGAVPAGLSLELADALRKDDAALSACYADRDSLTGK